MTIKKSGQICRHHFGEKQILFFKGKKKILTKFESVSSDKFVCAVLVKNEFYFSKGIKKFSIQV